MCEMQAKTTRATKTHQSKHLFRVRRLWLCFCDDDGGHDGGHGECCGSVVCDV